MKSSKRKKIIIARSPQAAKTHGRNRALVLSDGAKMRKKETSLYERRCREFEKDDRRMRVFQEQDRQDFSRWIELEFAEQIKAAHVLNAKREELRELIETVLEYADYKGYGLPRTYKIIRDARQDGTLEALLAAMDEDKRRLADEAEAGGEDDDDDRIFEDIMREMHRMFEGDDEGDDESFGFDNRREGGQEPQKSSTEKTSDEYVKSLYRQLVKVLHPDTHQDRTESQERIWHDVQDAYKHRDVHRLEQLLNEVSGDSKQSLDFSTMPIGHIMALRIEVEQRLKALKASMRSLKRDPAWGFRDLLKRGGKQLTALKRKISEDLEHDLWLIEMQTQEHEAQIKKWERASERGKNPSSIKHKTKKSTKSAPRFREERSTWDDLFG